MCLQHDPLTATPGAIGINDEHLYLPFAVCLTLASKAYLDENENEANALVTQAMKLALAMSDRRLKVMAVEISLAKQAHFAKQYERARELYSNALSLLLLCQRIEDLVLSDLSSGLAETEFVIGNYFIARHHLQRAIDIDRKLLGEQSDEYKCHSSQLSAVEYAQRVRYTASYCTPQFAISA